MSPMSMRLRFFFMVRHEKKMKWTDGILNPSSYPSLMQLSTLPIVYIESEKKRLREDVMRDLVSFLHAPTKYSKHVNLIVYTSWVLVSHIPVWQKTAILHDVHRYFTSDEIIDIQEEDHYQAQAVCEYLKKRSPRKRKRDRAA